MAASNWDTFALDSAGEPSDGLFQASRGDLSVEIYKNWLYVRSPSMWVPGRFAFAEPTIMEIQQGELRVGGVEIYAVRGPSHELDNGGVYCCISEHIYEKDMPVIERFMVGIGIYGYRDDEWVGVTAEHVDYLRKVLTEAAAEHCIPEAAAELDLNAGRRFNQGDRFFARAFGIETPTAQAGEPGRPMINDAQEGLQRQIDGLDPSE